MSGLRARYKTLGELRTELRARLGFILQGPAAANNQAVLDSFLQEGHAVVYETLNPSPARKKTTIRLQPGEWLYDYHNDVEDEPIDPGNVLSIWVAISDTIREPLSQGISEADRAFETRQWPERYDTLNGQMELYPVPDQEYDLIVEYIAGPGRFTQDSDRSSVPDRLVFSYALANAKAHYRHPDAQAAATTYSTLMDSAKSKQHENRRYVKGKAISQDPQVVATASGYKLRV